MRAPTTPPTGGDIPSARPRLLFLCQNLPYPPDGGALIRSYHTLRILAKSFDVTAIHFYQYATKEGPDSVERAERHLGQWCDLEAFRIPQDASRLRYVWDHLRSVVSGRAYTRWMFDSDEAMRALDDVLGRRDFDMVHLDSLDLVAFLDRVPDVPTVVAHHNVESQLLRRRARSLSGPRRWYMAYQALLTAREERRWCPRVDLNLVVSEEDGETLRRIAPEAQTLVIPNGVDTSLLRPDDEGPRRGIVFVGGYSWFPNADGMDYFTDQILPRIRKERPDIEVVWVGRTPAEVRERYARRGIRMTGYVDDIRPYVHRAACFVVPLRVGGGTRLKILDAWALGKAVVSTSPGCEGLEVVDGENMLVADEPDAFADAVTDVLANNELRQRLERGGRSTVERLYDWEVIGQKLGEGYSSMLER